MIEREFVQPTQKEIEERKKMYDEAEALGIDLMGYDGSNHSSEQRRDIRKAVVLLGTGKEIPKDLRDRLISRKKLA